MVDLEAIEARWKSDRDYAMEPPNGDVPALIAEVRRLRAVLADVERAAASNYSVSTYNTSGEPGFVRLPLDKARELHAALGRLLGVTT